MIHGLLFIIIDSAFIFKMAERFSVELSPGGGGHCGNALSFRTVMKFYLECIIEHMDEKACCF